MTKKALIHGTRICEVVDTPFEVSNDLSWADVADNTVANQDTYVDGAVVKYVAPTLTYIEKRVAQFPTIGDQLDKLFHDMTAGKGDKTGEWYKAIAKVKSDNAKPE